ncbi:hypothetical protein ACIBMZ_29920 [Micromonospora sp. NPDC049900]|uniref:hypothetical protein n=1 Tax=Micromonospora sp. NPDC049900 TaxID=3364275 RepID=UPI0037B8C192
MIPATRLDLAAAFTAHAAAVLPAEPELVTVLGIDEVRRDNPAEASTRSPRRGPRPSTAGTSGFAIWSAGRGWLSLFGRLRAVQSAAAWLRGAEVGEDGSDLGSPVRQKRVRQ